MVPAWFRSLEEVRGGGVLELGLEWILGQEGTALRKAGWD